MKFSKYFNLFFYNSSYLEKHDPSFVRSLDVNSELFVKSNFPFAKKLLMFIKVASMKDEDFLNNDIDKILIQKRAEIEKIPIDHMFSHIEKEFIYLSKKVVEFNIEKYKEDSAFSRTIITKLIHFDKKKYYNSFKEFFYVFVINNFITLEEMYDVTVLYPRVEDEIFKNCFERLSEYKLFQMESNKFNKEYYFKFKCLFNETFYFSKTLLE